MERAEYKSLNAQIIEALKGVDVPIFYQGWRKTAEYPSPPTSYVVFYQMLMQEGLVASDDLQIMEHYIRVDVYGESNIDSIMERVHEAMLKGNFILRRAIDIPEEYGYHKSSTWLYYRNI